ncbi:site-specific integrase [Bacteroides gallinarum]|uniref:site-specific integrase n=1 Tax=Bacteroides gallinarum TaxID=376806 RepID=UPI0003705F31|nr:site-specific integrase [Bacteroides gallinarum]
MKRNTDNTEIKRRSTFAVLFYINRTKIRKDGTCQLLCKVSIDGEWEQIGTKVSVNPSVWNPEKGRADGRSENAMTVNRAIDDLTKEINGHYRRIKGNLGFITAEQVKNAVMGVGQKPLTLLALFREHNDEFRKRVGVDRIKETYDSYMRSYKHLSAFVHEKLETEDVALRSLDRAFYDDFELFLRNDRNLSPKTVHEHLYRLKKLTMRAVSQGTLRRDPYCRLHPELPRRKSRHLKLEDLKKLLETPVEKPQLQFVRDMFIFSTFTGLAYADLKKLTTNDITQVADGTWWIHIRRQKTDTLSTVRLLDIPLRIIEKYREQRQGDKIFNLYSRGYLIRLTKELGEVYGFDLTFHKGRHNFGTHITLSLGVPIETVGKMMGHMRIETTQIYAKVTDRKVDEDMKRLKSSGISRGIGLYEEEFPSGQRAKKTARL